MLLQSCQTLCDPMDCGAPGSSVHGILQERIFKSVASPFSRGSSQPRDGTHMVLTIKSKTVLKFLVSPW